MKMRFHIDYKVNNDKTITLFEVNSFLRIQNSILMKHIIYVVIDGIKYEKPKGDSMKIQRYYQLIGTNRMKVTELYTKHQEHIFIKNGKYHSYDKYCYSRPDEPNKYAIDGKLLKSDEIRSFVIRQKIKLINEKLNG